MTIRYVAALVLVAGAIAGAQAETFPSRPITIIAPTTAGGPPDTIARLLSDRMKAVLGQPIIVENVTGAGSTLGLARVARSAPDGYTVSIGHLNSHVFSSLIVQHDLRRAERLRPGHHADHRADVVHRTQRPAAERHDGAYRLAQGQSHDRLVRCGWCRRAGHGLGHRLQGPQRRAVSSSSPTAARPRSCRTWSRARSISAAPRRRTCCRICAAARSRRSPCSTRERWSVAPEIPLIDDALGFTMTFWHGLWVPKGTPPDVIARA